MSFEIVVTPAERTYSAIETVMFHSVATAEQQTVTAAVNRVPSPIVRATKKLNESIRSQPRPKSVVGGAPLPPSPTAVTATKTQTPSSPRAAVAAITVAAPCDSTNGNVFRLDAEF